MLVLAAVAVAAAAAVGISQASASASTFSQLGRVVVSVGGGGPGRAGASVLVRDRVHDGGDVVATAPPCRLVCVWKRPSPGAVFVSAKKEKKKKGNFT